MKTFDKNIRKEIMKDPNLAKEYDRLWAKYKPNRRLLEAKMLDIIEDIQLVKFVKERLEEEKIEVKIQDL